MALDMDEVGAILRQHWQVPSDLSRAKLQEHVGESTFGPTKVFTDN